MRHVRLGKWARVTLPVGKCAIATLLAISTRLALGGTTTSFIGLDQGLWSNPLNWDNGLPNSASFDVLVNSATPITVQLDTVVTISNLSLTWPNSLAIQPAKTLTLAGSALTNSGSIVLTGIGPALGISQDTILSGGGTILLSGSSGKITGTSQMRLTTDNLITGSGSIGLGLLKLTNSGTITASGGILTVAPFRSSDDFYNTGTLRADGGSLVISGPSPGVTVTNTGGVIEAAGNSEVRTTDYVLIAEGIITSAPNGSITLGGFAALRDVKLSGNVFNLPGAIPSLSFNGTVSNTGSLTLLTGTSPKINGTLTNSGMLAINNGGALQLFDKGVLTGDGTIVLTGVNSLIYGGGKLSNTSTIIGQGQINAAFTNTGHIVASVGQLLLLPTGPTSNSGTITASGGTVAIGRTANSAPMSNSDGLIQAIDASLVALTNATIPGGLYRAIDQSKITLTNSTISNAACVLQGSSTFSASGLNWQNGNLDTDGGTLTFDAPSTFAGSITNTGNLAFRATPSGSPLKVPFFSGPMVNSGTMTFQNTTQLTLVPSGTSSAGTILNAGTMSFPYTTTLTISPSGMTNTGTMLLGAGSLVLNVADSNSVSLSSSGLILLNNSVSQFLSNGTLVNAGIISGQGQIGVLNQNNVQVNIKIINTGTITATAGTLILSPVSQAGAFVNSGVLRADGGMLDIHQGTCNNTAGVIQAANHSRVLIGGITPNGYAPYPPTTIIDGELQALTGSTLSLRGNSTAALKTDPDGLIRIDNYQSYSSGVVITQLDNSGHIFIENGSKVILSGHVVNHGTIELGSLPGGSTTAGLFTDSGTTTLTGGGSILINNSSPGYLRSFDGTSNISRLVTDNFIYGAGTIGTSPAGFVNLNTVINLCLTNNGTVAATSKILGIFTPNVADALINNNTLRADGATLTLNGGPVTNDGVIEAIHGGRVIFNTSVSGGTLTATGASVSAGTSNSTLTLQSLQLSTATLDLAGSKLILQIATSSGLSGASHFALAPADKPATMAYLAGMLQSGYHSGDWLGTGITSSTVAIDQSATGSHTTTLALLDNADLGLTTFGGQVVDNNSLLVTMSLTGDTNFDGHVDETDFQTWYSHSLQATFFATRGDFNFDGVADGRDFDLWYTSAPNAQSILDGLGLDRAALSALRAVPEPATLVLTFPAAFLLLLRQSRHGKAWRGT
jgi:hypothetical protein